MEEAWRRMASFCGWFEFSLVAVICAALVVFQFVESLLNLVCNKFPLGSGVWQRGCRVCLVADLVSGL
jgi:hypothetical protein